MCVYIYIYTHTYMYLSLSLYKHTYTNLCIDKRIHGLEVHQQVEHASADEDIAELLFCLCLFLFCLVSCFISRMMSVFLCCHQCIVLLCNDIAEFYLSIELTHITLKDERACDVRVMYLTSNYTRSP